MMQNNPIRILLTPLRYLSRMGFIRLLGEVSILKIIPDYNSTTFKFSQSLALTTADN
jgi:hypothetical protein